MEPIEQRRHLASVSGDLSFEKRIHGGLYADDIQILQLNVGRRCNLSCKHCHVSAGPNQSEFMDRPVLERCLDVLRQYPIGTIDITGGAPEMNPHLSWFIHEAARLDRRLMVRSNLLILLEPEYRHIVDQYVSRKVEIITSLPDYHAEKTDRQRGPGAYAKIIRMIKIFNEMGYGQTGSGLVLNLVHNPVGAYLPGSQTGLEAEYRRRLLDEHGIVFNQLFSLTNCPVGRYMEYLMASDNYEDYMSELIDAFNPSAVDNVMCRVTLSVGWDGRLFDCDFNQMLEMPVNHGAPAHINIFNYNSLKTRRIVTANHCYACVAGQGSSCQGCLD